MAQNTLHVRASKAQVRRMVRALPHVLSGKVADPTGMVQGMQLLMGVQALSLIKDAFIAKARGGADEAGETWKPLSPYTIAYKRRHPGLAEKRKQAKAEGRPGRPLLTVKQNERWKSLYSRALHGLSGGRLTGPSPDEKAHAASYAWSVLKSEGAATIFDTYSTAPVEILRDTGVLFNSLSPGVDGPSGHPNQVFKVQPGEVIVGTNRKFAVVHHEGHGHVPQRRLWPEPARWPQRWWKLLGNRARDGAMAVLVRLLGG